MSPRSVTNPSPLKRFSFVDHWRPRVLHISIFHRLEIFSTNTNLIYSNSALPFSFGSLINELRRVIFQTILKSKNNPLRTMHPTLMQTLTELDQARRTRCLSNFIVHWKAGKRKRVAYRWAPSLRIRFYSRQGGLRFIPHYVRFVCGTGTRAIFSYSFRLDPRRRWLRATIHRPRIAAAVIYRFATRLEPRDNKGSR